MPFSRVTGVGFTEKKVSEDKKMKFEYTKDGKFLVTIPGRKYRIQYKVRDAIKLAKWILKVVEQDGG